MRGICYDFPGMTPSIPRPVREGLVRLAQATPGLELLMVFGSRARGDAHARSDWDFGFLAVEGMDVATLLGAIVEIAGSDRVDLVDLGRASGLLRYRAARDGRVLFEARPRLAERFCLEAAQFWCDVAPVLQQGYEGVLAGLKG
jgi:predicted nucleotidyltransferase